MKSGSGNKRNVSKTSQSRHFIPLQVIEIINTKVWIAMVIVHLSSNINHQVPENNTSVLITAIHVFLLISWRFGPIPSSVSMSSQSPDFMETLFLLSSSVHNHHPLNLSRLTNIGAMVKSRTWTHFLAFNFLPVEIRLKQIKNPSFV